MQESQEMELYRYLAAAASAAGGDGGGGGMNTYGGFCDGNNYSTSCSSFYGSSSNNNTSGIIMNEMVGREESKALAASRILHKEAEKRRRERINSHLDRLRSLLPCTSKTDKATLLSKVVQRVLELKRQTSELLELDNLMIPSENDEFGVYIHEDSTITNINPCLPYDIDDIDEGDGDGDGDGGVNDNNRIILRASLCCEDRPDLFTDLNQVLNALNLKTLRAEISTLGGRIQGVLVVSADKTCHQSEECAVFLRDALKGIVQRSGSDDRLKRRRRVFDPNC